MVFAFLGLAVHWPGVALAGLSSAGDDHIYCVLPFAPGEKANIRRLLLGQVALKKQVCYCIGKTIEVGESIKTTQDNNIIKIQAQ